MTEFTIEFLASQSGMVAAVTVIVEAVKWAGGLKGKPALLRALALLSGIVLSIVFLPTLAVTSVVAAVLNGILVALIAMKGYELVAPAAKRIWNG